MKAPSYYVTKLESILKLPMGSINAFLALFSAIYLLAAATNSFPRMPEAMTVIIGAFALISLGALDPIYRLSSSGKKFIFNPNRQETK
jgi:hypothetical protein